MGIEIQVNTLEEMCSLMCDNVIPTRQTTCRRCGRKLRSPEAIEIGMGPTCWRKWQNEDNHKKLFIMEEE